MGLRYDRAGNAVYRSPRWKSVRFLAKRRDGWRCVKCGASGCRLEVDHIRAIREAPESAYDLANLQTLCVSCHSRKTQSEVGLHFEGTDPQRLAWRKLTRELTRKPLKALE
jgi:5-methylcytosine-specific restriction endonuclease McrA